MRPRVAKGLFGNPDWVSSALPRNAVILFSTSFSSGSIVLQPDCIVIQFDMRLEFCTELIYYFVQVATLDLVSGANNSAIVWILASLQDLGDEIHCRSLRKWVLCVQRTRYDNSVPVSLDGNWFSKRIFAARLDVCSFSACTHVNHAVLSQTSTSTWQSTALGLNQPSWSSAQWKNTSWVWDTQAVMSHCNEFNWLCMLCRFVYSIKLACQIQCPWTWEQESDLAWPKLEARFTCCMWVVCKWWMGFLCSSTHIQCNYLTLMSSCRHELQL